MSEMVERVGSVIREQSLIDASGWYELARAAIAAMREPTIEMIEAVKGTQIFSIENKNISAAWKAMIDSALAEKDANK